MVKGGGVFLLPVENILKIHDLVQDELKLMVNSKIRLNILTSISQHPKSMRDIKEEHNLSFASISINMKRLLAENLVIKRRDKYFISSLGYLNLYSLLDFFQLISVTNKFEELWLNHDISGIPDNIIGNFGLLKDSKLIKANHIDIYKIHNNFLDLLIQSKEVRTVSPISHPDLSEVYASMIKRNTPLILILTKEIIKQLLNSLDFNFISEGISNQTLEIRLYEGELKVVFTVTDKFLSLGLFNHDGSYDQNRDLVSMDKNAIQWAESLFDYYYQKSLKLTPKKLAKMK